MKKERRHWSADEKIKLLRRHLIEKVPISKICDEAQFGAQSVSPLAGAVVPECRFGAGGQTRPERNQDQQRIEKLESKIRQKDEVLAELMAEHIALKKELGEL